MHDDWYEIHLCIIVWIHFKPSNKAIKKYDSQNVKLFKFYLANQKIVNVMYSIYVVIIIA